MRTTPRGSRCAHRSRACCERRPGVSGRDATMERGPRAGRDHRQGARTVQYVTGDGTSRIVGPEAALLALLGKRDETLREAEGLLAADVHVRGNELTLTGEPADVAFAERVFAELVVLASRGQQIDPDAVRR